MKILLIDNSADVQQRWIEPLRNEGWGMIRARSTEDAGKILAFHRGSLDFIVVHEKDVKFAEKAGTPFIVLTEAWTEREIMHHQNSDASAVSYLPAGSDGKALQQVIESFKVSVLPVAKTGTDASSEPHEESSSDRTMMLDATNIDYSLEVQEVDLSAEAEPTPQMNSMTTTDLAIELTGVEEFKMPEAMPLESASLAPDLISEPIRTGSSDVDTLKSYLALREQDVALLSGQFRSSQERVQQLELQLKVERARSIELQHICQKQEQQIKSYDQDKEVEHEVLFKQIEDQTAQLKERNDKARVIEAKLKLMTSEVDKLKERVRVDIRRIRVREKELESQLEILKKDSAALLNARDEKITELKRKVDLLEFNMELVQEQYKKERAHTEQLRLRLKDAAQATRMANGLLEQEN